MSRAGYLAKKAMPLKVLRIAREFKEWIWRRTHGVLPTEPMEDQFPLCSPNVWESIVDFYAGLPSPVIFEYGTGASSIHHVRNLLTKGGTYIGVEHKSDWYAHVLDAVLQYSVRHSLNIELTGQLAPMPTDFPALAYDAVFRLNGRNVTGCTVILKLRPPHNRTRDADGSLAEFREYVRALNEACDVVIVDGRARKGCINYVLDNNLVKPGGLLVLFEAGRGVDGWLGWPALSGTSDYQPEVQRMLALGGKLFDGCGVDRWPGLTKRRTPGSNAYFYPLEACFLVLKVI